MQQLGLTTVLFMKLYNGPPSLSEAIFILIGKALMGKLPTYISNLLTYQNSVYKKYILLIIPSTKTEFV